MKLLSHHHRSATERAIERLIQHDPEIVAIFLAGSLAKGRGRPNSDVDLIVVTSDRSFRAREAAGTDAFIWTDICDYEGGYVEGKVFSMDYLREAAIRGSEPTRHSFLQARLVFGNTPEITTLAKQITTYPEESRDERIRSFLAQLQINRSYYWHEGHQRGDLFLKWSASVNIVHFACRLILAHNRILYPCRKDLRSYTSEAKSKPDRFDTLLDQFLADNTEEAKEQFCDAVVNHGEWKDAKGLHSLFERDAEKAWFLKSHDVGEW